MVDGYKLPIVRLLLYERVKKDDLPGIGDTTVPQMVDLDGGNNQNGLRDSSIKLNPNSFR